MAYRQSERRQQMMFPPSLDEYIEPDDPVRLYDAFGDTLDLAALGIVSTPDQRGCPAYPPRTMLKILVYGYSYGIRSSRKLERALSHNLSFLWLAGGLKPDFKTISRFRRDHRQALKQVLGHCARLCLKLGVVSGNTLFVDGTKLRANASIKNTWNQKRIDETLMKVDKKIDAILRECENIDGQDDAAESLVRLQGELQNQRVLREKVEQIALELQSNDRRSINTTAARTKMRKMLYTQQIAL